MTLPRWFLAAVFAGLVLVPAPARAHPLGLPAVAQITATGAREVTITWNAAPDDVATLARALGRVPAGAMLTSAEDAALARSAELDAAVRAQVRVVQDGAACAPDPVPSASIVRQGITVRFRCAARIAQVAVSIELLHGVDARYRTLAGAFGPEGRTNAMFTMSAPTHTLTLDPDAPGPLDTTPLSTRGGGALGGVAWLERPFVAAIDGRTGALAMLVGLLIALGVGAAHALAPGHGKAIAAGYLVGEGGQVRHAVLMGTSVAAMHTGSVLVLGFALYSASRRPDMAALTRAIQVVTGVVFASIGGWLLARRIRERGAPHEHGAVPAASAGSWQRVVALGAAGGMLPSPAALLVLLTALALGRVGYGVALIGAFSVGLAASLTAIGIAVVRGRVVAGSRLAGRAHGLLHAAPLVGASAVVLVGSLLVARALLA